GSSFGGHALYVKDRRLHYVSNYVGALEQMVVGEEDIPAGANQILSAAFEKDGGDNVSATGLLTLYHGEKQVGQGRIKTQLGAFAIAGEGLRTGRDGGNPVTRDYPGERPWQFTGGRLRTVAVDVSGEPYVDLEREAVAMMARE
ncbi:MAG TPA: arylsulfatase, partial [Baekduia sp.]|nr:arylsulfatase [Baekduia sp.]